MSVLHDFAVILLMNVLAEHSHCYSGKHLFITPQTTVWNSSVCSDHGGRLYGGSFKTDSKELISLLEQNYTEGWINIRSQYGPKWINGKPFDIAVAQAPGNCGTFIGKKILTVDCLIQKPFFCDANGIGNLLCDNGLSLPTTYLTTREGTVFCPPDHLDWYSAVKACENKSASLYHEKAFPDMAEGCNISAASFWIGLHMRHIYSIDSNGSGVSIDAKKLLCHFREDEDESIKCGLLSYKDKQLICLQVNCSESYPSICEPYMESSIFDKDKPIQADTEPLWYQHWAVLLGLGIFVALMLTVPIIYVSRRPIMSRVMGSRPESSNDSSDYLTPRQESRADSAGYLAPDETARIASEYLTAPHHSP